MRVVFMGTPESAVPALTAILAAGHEIPLVVTQPDRPSGRSRAPRPPPIKAAALARGSRVIQPVKVRTPEFLDTIAAVGPDALVVVAYGRILPRAVLDAAPHGAINLHFSLLPAYRGAAPVQWALARGEHETGVTTFRLDDGLDTGDLLAQRRVAIAPDERAPALLARLSQDGARLLAETLQGLAAGTIDPIPQDDERATIAPILTRTDGFWDTTWTAQELEGRVRGFDPWPGVWALRSGQRLRIAASHVLSGVATEVTPGTILALDGDALRLACASGSVASMDRVQREGGREMSGREAVHGRLLVAGDRLEPPDRAA